MNRGRKQYSDASTFVVEWLLYWVKFWGKKNQNGRQKSNQSKFRPMASSLAASRSLGDPKSETFFATNFFCVFCKIEFWKFAQNLPFWSKIQKSKTLIELATPPRRIRRRFFEHSHRHSFFMLFLFIQYSSETRGPFFTQFFFHLVTKGKIFNFTMKVTVKKWTTLVNSRPILSS